MPALPPPPGTPLPGGALPRSSFEDLAGQSPSLGGVCSLGGSLTYVRLTGFEGSLPECVGQLKRVTHLHLDGNFLSSLPPVLGNLSALRVLRGYQNGCFTHPVAGDEHCVPLYKVCGVLMGVCTGTRGARWTAVVLTLRPVPSPLPTSRLCRARFGSAPAAP